MKTLRIRNLVVLGLLLSWTLAATAAIYYVDGDTGSDANNGTGWDDAFETLTFALSKATDGDEIWVKAGVYRPTTDTDRTKSFVMKDGVDLYGGFAGTETLREDRDWTNHVTILCGDIGVLDDLTDNSYNVVVGANARLDGFKIRNGYASGGTLATYSGGGLYGNNINAMIVANCIFTNNHARGTSHLTRGGAAYFGGTGDPDSQWINTVFVDNFCTRRGGALAADSPLGTFNNCRFYGNSTSSSGGGAVELRANAAVPVMATFTNCVFIGNFSDPSGFSGAGGGAVRVESPGIFLDCWFEDNWKASAQRTGNAIYWNTGSQTGLVANCIFTNHVATGSGTIAHHSGYLTVSNSQFLANRASSGGGGIYLTGTESELTVFDSTFTSNYVTSGGSGGGAIQQQGGVLRVFDSQFISNRAEQQDGPGGAISMWGGEMLLDNCDFIGNHTLGNRRAPGGAIRIGQDLAPIILNSTFVGNFINNAYLGGTQSAGGALFSDGPAKIQRCVFVGNEAKNRAQNRGGAVAFHNFTNDTAQVVNTLFRDNIGYGGGAVFVNNATVAISNVTAVSNISVNADFGGALGQDVSDETVQVINSIFWDNSTTEILPTDNVTVRYSNVQGGFDGEGNLDTDPLFADGIYLHLLSTTAYYDGGYFSGGEWLRAAVHSPLIDAGDPASSWALEPHPHYGERINMGAYGNTEVASRSRIPLGTLIMIR